MFTCSMTHQRFIGLGGLAKRQTRAALVGVPSAASRQKI